MKRTAVIMAGGAGERFWPLSRTRKPKQLLRLASDKTMIEDTIDRISPLISPQDVFIITGEHLLEPMRTALPQIPPQNIIAEPYKRNTAPCLALAAAFIAENYAGDYNPDNISIAVLTADQNIYPKQGFIDTVNSALEYVENNPALGTIGIAPDRPETGYGYIEVDSNAGQGKIKKAIRFIEKPDLEHARQYLADGNKYWNSGMFFWRLDVFTQAMIDCAPEIGNGIASMRAAYQGNTATPYNSAFPPVAPIFENFPNISIDYALMEKAPNVVVARAEFSWDDIGSWDSLDRVRKPDDKGNILEGHNALVDTSNSIIINASADNSTIVAAVGLDNIAIVVTDDAVLVCPKERVQDVKKCVEIIKAKEGNQWL